MNLKLKIISPEDYIDEKNNLEHLVDKIWLRKIDSDEAKAAMKRWAEENRNGFYFYVFNGKELIGITGFYFVDFKKGFLGLRHHGTIKKGTGKLILDLLINFLKSRYLNLKSISELVPYGRDELLPIFKKWGFEIDLKDKYSKTNNYYQYLVIRNI